MGQKIAVAFIHGIGRTTPDFADKMMADLRRRFTAGGGAESDLVMKPVYWSPALQGAEDELWARIRRGGPLGYERMREFMVGFAADAIAYQPVPKDRRVYDGVHREVAKAIRALAEAAGPSAPLCVVAHSLGTVIASNYIYDLQADAERRTIVKAVRDEMSGTPLERGETLGLLYTLGSPIALWSLRYTNFGKPIQVPAPQFAAFWPNVAGEWVNFYDTDDVIGYPLKGVNEAYAAAVKEDRAVNVGGFLRSWSPLSHTEYWTDKNVTTPIGDALVRLWRQANP